MELERKNKLILAIAEAERFIERAKPALASCRQVKAPTGPGEPLFFYEDYDNSAMAAAKRSSMDLSKALSSFRRKD